MGDGSFGILLAGAGAGRGRRGVGMSFLFNSREQLLEASQSWFLGFWAFPWFFQEIFPARNGRNDPGGAWYLVLWIQGMVHRLGRSHQHSSNMGIYWKTTAYQSTCKAVNETNRFSDLRQGRALKQPTMQLVHMVASWLLGGRFRMLLAPGLQSGVGVLEKASRRKYHSLWSLRVSSSELGESSGETLSGRD